MLLGSLSKSAGAKAAMQLLNQGLKEVGKREVASGNVTAKGLATIVSQQPAAALPLLLNAMSMRSASTTACYIKDTDGQGHGDYLTKFERATMEELYNTMEAMGFPRSQLALESDAVYGSGRDSVGTHFKIAGISTDYLREIFMGDSVTAEVVPIKMDAERGLVTLRKTLINQDGKRVSAGRYTLSKHEGDRSAHLTDGELQKFGSKKDDTYSAEVRGIRFPSSERPTSVLGKEIELRPEENYVKESQCGHAGVIRPEKLFEILHTYGYEKGVMERTGNGFESKSCKPVMANSDFRVFGSLRAGDRYKVFVATNDSGIDRSRYSWTGSVVDEGGNIVATVRCNHALLALTKGFEAPTEAFKERLASLQGPDKYCGLDDESDRSALDLRQLGVGSLGERTDVIISAPGKMNAISADTVQEQVELLKHLKSSGSELLLFHSGKGRQFVVGADVPAFARAESREAVIDFSNRSQQVNLELERLVHDGISSVAIIDGFALGGGAEWAMACEYRVATPNGKFGLVEPLLGAFACHRGPQQAVRLAGPLAAAYAVANGHQMNSEEALELGFIDKIIDTNEDLERFIEGRSVQQSNREQIEVDDVVVQNFHSLLMDKFNALRARQTEALKQGIEASGLSDEEAEMVEKNITAWLDGLLAGRKAGLEVLEAQRALGSDEERNACEQERFADLVATDLSQHATNFWLLEKGRYKVEHNIVQEHLMPHLYITFQEYQDMVE